MKLKTILAGCAVAVTAAMAQDVDARELRFGTAVPETSPWGEVVNAFAVKLEEVSGGELTTKIFFNSALGDEQKMLRQTVSGRLDIATLSTHAISLAVPDIELLLQSYLFDSRDQRYCVEDNHIEEIFSDMFGDAGVVNLTYAELGSEVVFSQTPIVSPDDLSGVKIRTPPIATSSSYFQAMGASVSTPGVADIIPNLKTGAINAVAVNVVFGIAIGVPAVTGNITMTEHARTPGVVVVSQRTWNGLSEQEQEWLREAGTEFLKLRPIIQGAEKHLLEKVKEAGGTVLELTPEQIEAWKAIAEANRAESVAQVSDTANATWEKLQQAKAACN
ncbi:TRAP transporter substrate-binding protein [Ruegeria jejuensis]|uniref:TRAP transporter substrate-binding protein n=1 Tax=Ruegeria jejuensis TaxID=3233338 RepID=UPI00355B9AD9